MDTPDYAVFHMPKRTSKRACHSFRKRALFELKGGYIVLPSITLVEFKGDETKIHLSGGNSITIETIDWPAIREAVELYYATG